MKKNTKPSASAGAKCTSNVSGGALRCVLEGDHTVHSTKTKRGGQFTTWSTASSGKVHVTAYDLKGKKMGEWDEDARPASKLCGAHWVRGADGVKIPKEQQLECGRDPGHTGDHRALSGSHVTSWSDDRNGAVHTPTTDVDALAALASPAQNADVAKVFGPSAGPAKSRKKHIDAVAAEMGAELGASSVTVSVDGGPPVVVWESFEIGQRVRMAKRARGSKETGTVRDLIETTEGTKRALVAWPDSEQFVDLVALVSVPNETPETASQAEAVPCGNLILGYRRHPAAALFELLEGEQLDALADSIEANGQRDPIVLVTVDGETFILDGSNRGRACEMRGIAPRTTDYEGQTDMASLVAYSMDKNRHRRHQEPSVLAMVAVDAGQLLGRGNPGDRESGRSAGLMTQAEAGKRLGVSERLIRKAKVVKDKGTAKLQEAVRKNKIALDGAVDVAKLPAEKQDELADRALAKTGQTKSGHVRALARQEVRRDVVLKINRGQVPAIADLVDSFGVMLWDPPWEYDNSDDHPSARGHIKYPSMSLEQLVELGREAIAKLRDDAVIVTWATNPRMPVAVHLIEALGLEWQSMGTWVKSRIGMGPLNMRSRTEHYIVATRGKPVHTLNEVSTWLGDQPLDRTNEHSEKPDELHVLLEQHCSGPFLELFARGPRESWTTWGAEADKFAAEAA